MVVSDEIRNKAMKEITDYFQKFPAGHTIYAEFLATRNVCEKKDVMHLIKVLEAEELIEYAPRDDDPIPSIHLAPKGHTYFESLEKESEARKAQQKAEARDTKRFWLEIIKDVLVFIAGILIGNFG